MLPEYHGSNDQHDGEICEQSRGYSHRTYGTFIGGEEKNGRAASQNVT